MLEVRFFCKDGIIVTHRCSDIKVAYGWMEHPEWTVMIDDWDEVNKAELINKVTGEIIKSVECA